MATAPIGHNQGPNIREMALLDGTEALKPLIERAAELVASSQKAHASDPESAGKCADLVKMIRACDKALDDKRKDVQAPYKAAVDLLMDMPRKAKFDLSAAKRDLEDKITAFDRAERKRLKEIADAKAAEEAAANEALAQRAEAMGVDLPVEEPAAEPARAKPVSTVASDMGSSTHTRKVKVFTVTDPYALPLDILNHEKVVDAIVSVAREMHRADPERRIKGILITEDEQVVVR